MSASSDLRHFLGLAASQLRHRIKQVESETTKDNQKLNRMHLLEDLIKEQVTTNGNDKKEDSRPAIS